MTDELASVVDEAVLKNTTLSLFALFTQIKGMDIYA